MLTEIYGFGERDDQPWETDFPDCGRTFPHSYGTADGKYYTTMLTLSPAGDEVTLGFAKTLMNAAGLDKTEVETAAPRNCKNSPASHWPSAAQRVARRVNTIDVAPTIAAYLGTKPPSGATGRPLVEVLP